MLLDKTNKAMPDADVTQADIIHAYVGLRPLVADMDDQADATYGLSRGSEIYDHARHGGPQGLVSALGGKWTTSRRLGEQIVDLAFAKLGRPLANKRSADTLLACAPREDLGLFMDRMRAAYPALETETIDVLSRLYGSLLPEMMVADTSGLEALGDEVLAARIAFALNDEMAAHLTDVVMRRLVEGQLGLIDKKQSDIIAAYMAERLGWDASALKKQKAALARAWALPNSRAKAPAQPQNKTPGKTPGKTKGKTAAPRRAKSKKA
jgi:glycerol-3-phosphate dehydrogenase